MPHEPAQSLFPGTPRTVWYRANMANNEQSSRSANENEYLTVEEAAALIRMPISSFRQKVYSGALEAFRPGKRVLVSRSGLNAFMLAHRVGGGR